jgi:indolepyruvate ferredoxin oxidoreductase beta subunit
MMIARDLGDIRLGNTVMLGAIADYLPFPADVLLALHRQALRAQGREGRRTNRQAFAAGRAAAEEAAKAEAAAAL